MRLTPQQEELVERLVSEGEYSNAGEVIGDGLRLLEQELAWKADCRQKIDEGMEDLKAGRVVNGEQAIRDLLAKLRRDRNKK